MNEMGAAVTMVLLFALRCIVPLVLMVFIGWLMNRMVDQWEAEETAVSIPQLSKPQPKTTAPNPIPAIISCWVFNNCDASDCAAYGNTAVTCWKIKLSPSGQLPAKCKTCPIYVRSKPAI